MFAPIGGEGLAQQAVRRLAEGIGLGLLRPGDRLPPESQLAEWLGISAMTLREALAILRQAGYLETVRGQGGGTFVRHGPVLPTAAQARTALARITPEMLTDFSDLRQAISGEACALAAQRATAEEIADIGRLAQEMCGVSRFGPYRRLDAAFHIGIASAARSTRLATAEAKLQVELGEIIDAVLTLFTQETDPVLRASNREHLALAEALADRDPERARSIIATHVKGSSDLLIAFVGGRSADEGRESP